MADERYTFAQARARLEEIVLQVRKKDVSLEKSLDLLEEGVRLANVCTELSDHTEWRTVADEQRDVADETEPRSDDEAVTEGESSGGGDDEPAGDGEGRVTEE
jgi:exodeoxyribonuclease VII small subunit